LVCSFITGRNYTNMFNVILFVWRKVDVNLFFVRLFGLL
jgi:hypothetical protein